MHAVSVSGLKHNPAEALRQAKTRPVVVLNRDNPDAVLLGLEDGGMLQAPGVRAAMATALFRDGELSLVRAAHVAEMDVTRFIAHLSRLGSRRSGSQRPKPTLISTPWSSGFNHHQRRQPPDRPRSGGRAWLAADLVQRGADH